MYRFSENIFKLKILITLLMMAAGAGVVAQEKPENPPDDTLRVMNGNDLSAKSSKAIKPHNPRTATIRSAVLPGWGQIYNKKYWKLPIVYGALGTTAGIFAFNLGNYRDTRFAYNAKYKASLPPPLRDSTDYFKIKPELMPLSLESLRFYRNQFRRDIDYSVFFFLLAWALNVVDATVDAHLKTFDVSPDLSFRIVPGHSELAGTTGVSFVLLIGKDKVR
jgi:hypothetical protein